MSKSNGKNRAYTLAGAADYLGINRARVNQLIKAGRFPETEAIIGAGGTETRYIVREDALAKFKAERAKAAVVREKARRK